MSLLGFLVSSFNTVRTGHLDPDAHGVDWVTIISLACLYLELQNNLFKLHPMWHLIKTVQSAPRSQEHVTVRSLCSFLENDIKRPDRRPKKAQTASHKAKGIKAP